MAEEARGGGRRSEVAALLVIGLGLFVALLDATVVNVSLPAMMEDFGVGVSRISWVANAYNLAFAAVLVTGGRLADQFGRRRTYALAVAGFVAFSAACALAPSAGWLVAFRAAQGLAGAVLVPATLALVVAAFPKEKLGAGLGAWGAIGAFAAALGPPLGGALTEWASWRWVFWVNVPVGLAAVALSYAFLAESRDPGAGRRVDLAGIATLSAGLFALALALVRGEDWGWTGGRVLSLFAFSAAALLLWVFAELKTKAPMVDLAVFKNRTFAAASAVLFFTGFGYMGGVFLLPQFLVRVSGLTELAAGLALTPSALTVMLVGALVGRVSDRVGPRVPVVAGVLLTTAGLVLLSDLEAGDGARAVLLPLVLLGAGLGFSLVPANTAAMAALPGEGVGVASGVLTTFRMLGTVFGVAVVVAALNVHLSQETAHARQEMRAVVAGADLPRPVSTGLRRAVSGFELGDAQPPSGLSAPAAGDGRAPSELSRTVAGMREAAEERSADAFDETFPFGAAATLVALVPALMLGSGKGPAVTVGGAAPDGDDEGARGARGRRRARRWRTRTQALRGRGGA